MAWQWHATPLQVEAKRNGASEALVANSAGGLVQSFKSGEGLAFDFAGPGRVWVQTRNPTELLGWIQVAIGTSNAGATAGLGGLAGGLSGIFTRD